MNILTLDNKTLKWSPKGDSHIGDLKTNRSGLHFSARELLTEVYPTVSILQEVSIPVYERKTLHLDFYLPLYKLAVEVQGQQHFEFTPFFHGDIQGFVTSRKMMLPNLSGAILMGYA
jgi:hypothetical protein